MGKEWWCPSHESYEWVLYICIRINCCCLVYQEEQKLEVLSNKTVITHVSVTAVPCLGWVSPCLVWDFKGWDVEGGLCLGWEICSKIQCVQSCSMPLPVQQVTGSCLFSPCCVLHHPLITLHLALCWDESPTAPVWLSSLARGRSHVWRHWFLLLQNERSLSVKSCAACGQVILKNSLRFQ